MSATEAHGARLGVWLDVVRRARLPQDVKLFALMMASYANVDGQGVICSVARLAVDCELSYSGARKHLARLRKYGLVEVAKRGNRRRGRSDEYRLILHADILERLDLPNPEAYRRMVGDVIRDQQKATAERARQYRKRKKERDEEESNNAPDDAQAGRYSDGGDPVDNSVEGPEEAQGITPTAREGRALVDGITPQTSRNNAPGQLADLRVSSAHLPTSTSPIGTTSHLSREKPSLERSPSTRARAASETDRRSGLDPATAARYREAADALAVLADFGLSLRAEIRAELGEDVPEHEVVIEARDRFEQRRRA